MNEVRVLRTLRRSRDLKRFSVRTSAREVGPVANILFDTGSWEVRYLVVDAGGWFTSQKVLIAAEAVENIDEQARQILVKMSAEQIEAAPEYDAGKSITRDYEESYYRHYGWQPYWDRALFPGPVPARRARQPEPSQAPSLLAARELEGYRIHARDGRIGHVDDVIVDDLDWVVRYLEIDTRVLLPGKKVLLAPTWIEHIDWSEREVRVEQTCEAIREAPAYHPSEPISRDYEVELYAHYGKFAYWQDPS